MDCSIRASIWTRQETTLLLDLWEQETRRQNLDGTARNYKVHQRISQVLMAKGYCRSPMQVRERLKRLRREYRESRRCEYYDRVAAIMASTRAAANGADLVAAHDGAIDATSNAASPNDHHHILGGACDDDMVDSMKADDYSQTTSENETDYQDSRNGIDGSGGRNGNLVIDSNGGAATTNGNGSTPEDESLLLQRRTVQLLSALVEGQRRAQKSTVCFQRQMLQHMHAMSGAMQTVAGALARACLYMPPGDRADGACSPSYAASLLEHDDLIESREADTPSPRNYVKHEPSD
ncbi:uncharacterized protein LOC119383517 [Rhipicephalus sanguineus]|uniref:Myb/SANT-like DNA-binding domain-containing protein n=1 Tax=Rhipicephalus sanguineus TaxID=34632 RepID=A0A9D4Q732_RHISA|nr:uncharacterized protein LOC119383517 [Rhipicephalus sanguineus]KAH7969564.1 hypothetical protein HPB52_019569 [Rhipicephalus sanguineus]